MESMYSFYKRFDSSLATWKLTDCDETNFPGLEKNADNAKDYGQHITDMCFIKTADPQHFSHLWNKLENGTILGESTDMHPANISKTYDVLWKYKRPENSTRIPCNYANVNFYQQVPGKQTCQPVAGTDRILHRDVTWYNFNRTVKYSDKFNLPDFLKTGTKYPQLGYYFAHTTPVQQDVINLNWILL